MGNASPGEAREDTASGEIRKVRAVPLCGTSSWNPAHRLAVIPWHSPFTYFGFPTMPFGFRKASQLKMSKHQQAKNPADHLIGKRPTLVIIQILLSYSRVWCSNYT